MQLINIGSPVTSGQAGPPTSGQSVSWKTQTTGTVTTTNREVWMPFYVKAAFEVDKLHTYETTGTSGNYVVGIADDSGALIAQAAERTGGAANGHVFHDVTNFNVAPGKTYFARIASGANGNVGRFNSDYDNPLIVLPEHGSENAPGRYVGFYRAKTYDSTLLSELPVNGSEVGFSTGFFFGLVAA